MKNFAWSVMCLMCVWTYSMGCQFGAAPSCALPCNCADRAEVCDPLTGACLVSGCRKGQPAGFDWGGPGCATGNIAYGKSASQTEAYVAGRAVNGNTSSDMEGGNCAHAVDSGSRTPWWAVDLGAEYVIHNVTVFTRDQSELKLFHVKTSLSADVTEARDLTDTCGFHEGTLGPSTVGVVSCPAPGHRARYVGITLSHIHYFSLCEVVVIGRRYTDCADCPGVACDAAIGCTAYMPREDGCQFGAAPSCALPCNCADRAEACDPLTGACLVSGCRKGQPAGFDWGGPGCATGNVAYGKPALHSTPKNPAVLAVDGADSGGRRDAGHCANPDAGWGYRAWWSVDLGALHVVYNVSIYREYSDLGLRGFSVYLGNSSDIGDPSRQVCGRWSGAALSPPAYTRIRCPGRPPPAARYITIQLDSVDENYMFRFWLCEVVVIGHRADLLSDSISSSTTASTAVNEDSTLSTSHTSTTTTTLMSTERTISTTPSPTSSSEVPISLSTPSAAPSSSTDHPSTPSTSESTSSSTQVSTTVATSTHAQVPNATAPTTHRATSRGDDDHNDTATTTPPPLHRAELIALVIVAVVLAALAAGCVAWLARNTCRERGCCGGCGCCRSEGKEEHEPSGPRGFDYQVFYTKNNGEKTAEVATESSS